MANHTTKQWTTRKLMAWTTDYFIQKKIDSPRLATEMLLSHCLGVERLGLYMDPDRPASEVELTAFRSLVERAAEHEPVDYLVGWTVFFSLKLKVDKNVLIPRPSTETLVEHIIQHSKKTPGFASPLIADIATGSGAIAIALAKHMPESRIIATDISQGALALAQENAQDHGVADRIEFHLHDMTSGLSDAPFNNAFDYLVSNPPYISDSEWAEVASNVKDYEPTAALRGGEDGLDFIRILIAQAGSCLGEQGQLILEMAACQKNSALQLAQEAGYTQPHVLSDHENLPRILIATKSS